MRVYTGCDVRLPGFVDPKLPGRRIPAPTAFRGRPQPEKRMAGVWPSPSIGDRRGTCPRRDPDAICDQAVSRICPILKLEYAIKGRESFAPLFFPALRDSTCKEDMCNGRQQKEGCRYQESGQS